jgi:hypothetical protein
MRPRPHPFAGASRPSRRRRTVCVGTLGLTLAVAAPAFAQARLEVGWISLDPQLPPPNRLDAPPGEGWPFEGDRVHWVAHVLNRDAETVAEVPYAWAIDDGTAVSGAVDLPPGETTVWLTWSWSFERHVVSFRLDPPAETGDARQDDDALSVFSDALSLGLNVEQDVYDWLLEHDGEGFERLMQNEIDYWNALFAESVHPTAPEGVLDRIRLDVVHVQPDGTGGSHDEFSTDLRWFFPARRSDSRFLHRGMDPQYRNDQTIVLHELLHGRGITDLYAYAVYHGDTAYTNSHVGIAEDGRLVAGTALMPNLSPRSSRVTVYQTPAFGLMGSRYRKRATNITEHTAFGLNLLAGRRTPQWFDQWGNRISLGNAVQPDGYLSLIPERTELRLVAPGGAPIPNARVEVFLDVGLHTYQDVYPETPARVLGADASGVVALPGDLLDELPFKRDAPPKSMVVILGVRTTAARGYAFLPVYDLNLLYIRGGRERAEMDLEVELLPR